MAGAAHTENVTLQDVRQGLASGRIDSGSPIPIMGCLDYEVRRFTPGNIAGGGQGDITWGDPAETANVQGPGGPFGTNPALEVGGVYEVVVNMDTAAGGASKAVVRFFHGIDPDLMESGDLIYAWNAVGHEYRVPIAGNQSAFFQYQFKLLDSSVRFSGDASVSAGNRGKLDKSMQGMFHVRVINGSATVAISWAVSLRRLR